MSASDDRGPLDSRDQVASPAADADASGAGGAAVRSGAGEARSERIAPADERGDPAEEKPRLAAPGPSFIREEIVTLRGPMGEPSRRMRAGMTAPSVMDDGWWLTHLWLADDGAIVEGAEIAPAGGPPPGTPLDALGPRLAGALSGLIDQEAGRQMIRLRMPPAPDESRPWQRPMLCMLAIRWDPIRASVMQRNELARELLRGFAAAVEGVGRPG